MQCCHYDRNAVTLDSWFFPTGRFALHTGQRKCPICRLIQHIRQSKHGEKLQYWQRTGAIRLGTWRTMRHAVPWMCLQERVHVLCSGRSDHIRGVPGGYVLRNTFRLPTVAVLRANRPQSGYRPLRHPIAASFGLRRHHIC